MLIVLEGADWSGKTTLSKEIWRRFAAKRQACLTIRKGPPKRHPLNEYVLPLVTYEPNVDQQHIICDRWHIGESIYPYVLGRKTVLEVATYAYIELFLQSRGASITVLRPSFDELQRRSAIREDDLVNPIRDLPELWRRYEECNGYSPAVRTPDECIAHAEGAARRAMVCAPFVTYVGHPAPRTIYVGDVRACKGGGGCPHEKRHHARGPAFMPYQSTSGLYLMRALTRGNMPDRVGLMNACDVDDIFAAYEAFLAPQVVALGARAHQKLSDEGIPHATAPHPQYVRRFHHAAIHAYGRLLANLVGTERNELAWRPSSQDVPVSGSIRKSLSVS